MQICGHFCHHNRTFRTFVLNPLPTFFVMLKQVQHDRILVQNSAKFVTKVQKWTGKSLHYKSALNSQQLGILANKNASKLS